MSGQSPPNVSSDLGKGERELCMWCRVLVSDWLSRFVARCLCAVCASVKLTLLLHADGPGCGVTLCADGGGKLSLFASRHFFRLYVVLGVYEVICGVVHGSSGVLGLSMLPCRHAVPLLILRVASSSAIFAQRLSRRECGRCFAVRCQTPRQVAGICLIYPLSSREDLSNKKCGFVCRRD